MEEEENKLFSQFKNYYLSNEEIIKILSNNYIDTNWLENNFYIISSKFLNEWKKLIHFNKICNKMHENINNNISKEVIQKDVFVKYIKKPEINLDELKQLSFVKLNTSFFNSNNSIVNSQNINAYGEFDLISKEAFKSFFKDANYIKYGKVSIIKGNKKIIVKIDQKCYSLFYLNKVDKSILPNELDKYLKELLIEIENKPQEELLNNFINKINKTNIDTWLKEINFNSLEKKEYSYEGIKFFIFHKDKKGIISINNLSNIQENSKLSITKSLTKSLIEDIKYINTIMVVKIKNTSYAITCMYSLSQIKEFAEYFFSKNIIFKDSTKLLTYFQEFINILWKRNEEEEKYEPKNFFLQLNKKDDDIFSFKEEKEPIVFLEKILKYINSELNHKDKDIENTLIHFKYINNDKNKDLFNIFYKKFLNNNNSIVSKIFYGIFKIIKLCDFCGESIEYKTFNYIDLNITNYSNYQHQLDNSLVYYYLDDLIEYYFNDENRESKCQKCYKNIKYTKKIIKFPDIIIFRINWGRFSKDTGFQYEEQIEKEKNLIIEENKLIFDNIIDLTNYDSNLNNKKIEYKIRSIINYPIINDNNRNDKACKKFITFSKHLVDNKFYSYQPNGPTTCINNFNRKKFIPSVLFFEKIK